MYNFNPGYNAGFYNPGFGMVGQGISTMNNLGSQIGNAFAQANAQSGINMANQVPVDVERMRQQGQMQRLQMLSPLLAGIFGGGGGGGFGGSTQPRSMTTNYGAGVSFGGNDGQQDDVMKKGVRYAAEGFNPQGYQAARQLPRNRVDTFTHRKL